MKKTHDLSVKKSSYTDKSGATKHRWLNIGALMEDDKGGKFIMLDRTFNPAGVPFKDGSESILVSMFEAKAQEQSAHDRSKANAYQPEEPVDEIPF